MKQIVDPYYDKLVEDEFYSAIENRDRKIEENKRILAEKDKILALQDRILVLQNKTLALQNTILAQINETQQQLSSVIKLLRDNGVDEELIAQVIDLSKHNSLKN